jgi:polyhydroxyalkanoate synthesis regulator phasin
VDTATKSDSLTEQESTDATPVEAAATPTNGVVNGAVSEASSTDGSSADSAEEQPKRGRPRKQSTAKKTRTIELTLTVTGTAEGEWQAELVHGGKRVVQGLAVSAAAVSRAAKELHPDISGNIDTVITAAREAHQQRMAELQAEMDKVKQALAELED